MGEASIQHCRSYALEAERKMGEMLLAGKAAGEVAGKGRPKNVTAGYIIPVQCDELGLSLKESAEAQRLAVLPLKVFEQVRTGEKTRTQVKREQRRAEVSKKVSKIPKGRFRVLYADCMQRRDDKPLASRLARFKS